MSKKLLSVLISMMFTVNTFAYAENLLSDSKILEDTNITLPMAKRFDNEINNAVEQIYGPEISPDVYKRVMEIAQKAIENRPVELKKQDLTRPDDWYKDEIIYMFYVDQFGVVSSEKPNQFKDTAEMFEYLKDLGVTTLYLLPFADSPMSDAGFDVKNRTMNLRIAPYGVVWLKLQRD